MHDVNHNEYNDQSKLWKNMMETPANEGGKIRRIHNWEWFGSRLRPAEKEARYLWVNHNDKSKISIKASQA